MKITTVPQNCGPSLLVINDILFGVTGKLIRFFLEKRFYYLTQMAILHLDIIDFGTSWLVLVSFNKLLFNISQWLCRASTGDVPSVDKKKI